MATRNKKKEVIDEEIIEKKEEIKRNNKKVKVIVPALNIREKPDIKSKILGCIKDNGIYELSEEVNGWGKLANRTGWISLEFCGTISE